MLCYAKSMFWLVPYPSSCYLTVLPLIHLEGVPHPKFNLKLNPALRQISGDV